jgi:radical SAM superfamily enzyme YgiQ (UPF0313 family)
MELLKNYEKFGITKYNLIDDLYNDSKKKVRELYDKVWSKLPFTPEWTSYMRLDMFWADPDSIDIVKASGAKLGSFGIETLDNKAGRYVGKGLGKERILKTLEMLKQKWGTDTLVSGLFIAGLPHESKESIINTIDWCKTTDLLYTYNFTPMMVIPPVHFDILNKNKISNISEQTEKYKITWITEKNWINSEGVTFEEANGLALYANQQKSMGLQVNQGHYPDLRSAGISHNEILKIKSDPGSMIERVREANCVKNTKVKNRMQKVLNFRDI